MSEIVKKLIIVVLFGIVNDSNHAKYIFLNNPKYGTRATLINLHPNEYSQEFHYYPFAVKIDRCLRFAILLKIYLIKYLFQSKWKI